MSTCFYCPVPFPLCSCKTADTKIWRHKPEAILLDSMPHSHCNSLSFFLLFNLSNKTVSRCRSVLYISRRVYNFLTDVVIRTRAMKRIWNSWIWLYFSLLKEGREKVCPLNERWNSHCGWRSEGYTPALINQTGFSAITKWKKESKSKKYTNNFLKVNQIPDSKYLQKFY